MRVGFPLLVWFRIGRGGGAVRGWGIGTLCVVRRWKCEFWHQREIGGMVEFVMR